MDGHTFISWNIPNFITVTIMAVLGVVILRTASALYAKHKAG